MTPGSIPFASFSAEVLALYHPPLRRVSTFRKMRQVLEEIGAICPTTADLSPATIAAWITAHPTRRSSTIRTLLVALRAGLKYGEARGHLSSPFRFRSVAQWVPRTDDEPARTHPGATEVGKVLLQADREAEAGAWHARRLQLLVYALAYTGARASEVLALRADDIDPVRAVVWIRPHARRPLKTARSRRAVPIAGPLHRVLETWLARTDRHSDWLIPHTRLDGPWLSGAPTAKPLAAVRELGRRAGVEGLTLLGFRHAFATSADRFGIGSKALTEILGHTTPATQWHYRHADPDEMRRAIDRVRFEHPSPPLP